MCKSLATATSGCFFAIAKKMPASGKMCFMIRQDTTLGYGMSKPAEKLAQGAPGFSDAGQFLGTVSGHKSDGDKKQKPVIIKKYANRRLYNTETSSYVTLEDLGDMVRSERDFLVYDAKSGEDLTPVSYTHLTLPTKRIV